MIAVAVCGGGGRIGGDVAAALAASAEFELRAILECGDHPGIGRPFHGAPMIGRRADLPGDCQVLVDFTAPACSDVYCAEAARRGLAFVCGATGLDERQKAALREAATRVPVVYAPNMSMGVTVVNRLLREAARLLPGYDLEIVEMHHRRKRDAPSGTALRFAETLESVRRDLQRAYGRSGATGARPANQIALHALRGGDVVGEHHVIFAGTGERVVLTHRAESRGAFVAGVLQAIRFVCGREPGFYAMEDVLGVEP